jgi:mono/diheme cytochrome c family protein
MIAATPWARLGGLAAAMGVAGLALGACATDTATSRVSTRPAASSLPSLDPQQQRGRDFAVRRCSSCHTVGLDDGGANDGPAFYQLARRYNPIALERRFAEISPHGVESMPAITFSNAEAADLIAYFDSLQGN